MPKTVYPKRWQDSDGFTCCFSHETTSMLTIRCSDHHWLVLQISGRSRPSDKSGGGGGSSRPRDGGGGLVSKKHFLALWASFWSKNKGGEEGGHGPLSWICHCKWSNVYPNCYDKLLCQSVLKHLPNFLTENQYFYTNKVKIKGPTKPLDHKAHTQMFFWLITQWNVWQSPLNIYVGGYWIIRLEDILRCWTSHSHCNYMANANSVHKEKLIKTLYGIR